MTDKKIVHYCIVHNNNIDEFEIVVNSHIENGWQPLGVPRTSTLNNDFGQYAIFYQAMVKYDEES